MLAGVGLLEEGDRAVKRATGQSRNNCLLNFPSRLAPRAGGVGPLQLLLLPRPALPPHGGRLGVVSASVRPISSTLSNRHAAILECSRKGNPA